jgi:hypothetical protein
MFEEVVTSETVEVITDISAATNGFYLAGGTGLALQLGHRMSLDLDFFSPVPFNTDIIANKIVPGEILFATEGTLHCELKGVKLSFLFYPEPLIYPETIWRGIRLADWRDIAAEKIKTISQRGAKKDFYDLYAVLKLKISIKELCQVVNKRFRGSGINRYHVLKSIFYFEEAEIDPDPVILIKDGDWQWRRVRDFFEKNIQEFEKHLLR